MIRRTLMLALVAASIGGLTAGCGGSSTPASTPASTSVGGTGTSSAGSSGGGAPSNPAAQAIVTACKQQVTGAASLSSSEKAKLNKLCEQAASGNLAAAKKTAADVCKELVNANLPAGTPSAVKDQALAACKKAAG